MHSIDKEFTKNHIFLLSYRTCNTVRYVTTLQAIQPILWKYGKSAEFELFRGSKEVPFSRNLECE